MTKSKARQKLEEKATDLGLPFDDDTTSKALGAAIKAAQAEREGSDPDAEASGDPAGGAEGAAKSPPKSAKPVGGIIVTGPKRGRWRAGRHFTPEPSVIALADLTKEQLAMIEADPALTVETVPAD